MPANVSRTADPLDGKQFDRPTKSVLRLRRVPCSAICFPEITWGSGVRGILHAPKLKLAQRELCRWTPVTFPVSDTDQNRQVLYRDFADDSWGR
jgi:hypothetical protein